MKEGFYFLLLLKISPAYSFSTLRGVCVYTSTSDRSE